MKELVRQIEKINGIGWFVGLIANVIATTLVAAGAYFALHEEIALLKVERQHTTEMVMEIRENMVTKEELKALVTIAEAKHAQYEEDIRALKFRDGMLSRNEAR